MIVLAISVGQKFKLINGETIYQKIEYEYHGCCNPDFNAINTETNQKLFINNLTEAVLWTD